MKDSIQISQKHGVNPMIAMCFFCNTEKNEILLLGKLPGDAEAPRRGVVNMEPCDKCKGLMEKGVILISARDGEEGSNPYRTGGWVVVTEDYVRRTFQPESMVDRVLRVRVSFVDDKTWDLLGLPRGSSTPTP